MALFFPQLGFYLKEYIKSQQLWDIYNPLQVHCGDDPLGQVFGVTKFTLEDARLLLLKNAIIVDGGFRKRAAVDGGGWGSPKKVGLVSRKIHPNVMTSSELSVTYRKVSNIRHTLVGNKIVDHSDVVGAARAPTTSSFLT